MSTKASIYTLLSEPSQELIVSEPWSIDTYADGLMDELFADIDHILDGRGGLPIPTIEPEFVRLQSMKMPPIVLKTTEVKSNTATTEAKNEQLRAAKPKTAAPKTVKVHKQPKRWLGKILGWSAATVGLVASVVFVQSSGLLNRLVSNSFQQSLLPSRPQAQPELATQIDVQADLVKYMLGALSVIDRESVKSNYQSARTAYTALTPNQSAQKGLVMASNPGFGQLPPPMAANNMQPTTSRAATVVERIYIPVYQAPLPMRYAPPAIPGVRGILPQVPSQPPSVAGLPKPPSVKTALNNVSKNVDKVTRPLNIFAAVRPGLKPLTIQSQPITLSQPKPPTIKVATFRAAPPKLPTATAPEPKATVLPKADAQVAVAPTNPISHTLEGLLELGDKSAALFKINGVTRRIEIGEGIGTSGWTLVEVVNGEAVIRRNGEVRSIYAGQNF